MTSFETQTEITGPKFDRKLGGEDPTKAACEFIEKKRQWFSLTQENNVDALHICHAHANLVDDAVSSLFELADKKYGGPCKFTVLGIGGYGRQEMGLYSDIDLLFLQDNCAKDYIRGITDGILYPFWNNSVEIGGATRSFEDCQSIINTDLKALTAMMDARFICGDSPLYDALRLLIEKHFEKHSNRRRFIDLKKEEYDARLKRFGDSIYLREPNVKEGEGGLRDFDTLLWIARAAYPKLPPQDIFKHAVPYEETQRKIDSARKFLWKVRNALHLVQGKRADWLNYALQIEVAKKLNISGLQDMSAAEALMSLYYENAAMLHFECGRAIQKISRFVSPLGLWSKLCKVRRMGKKIIKTGYGTISYEHRNIKTDPVSELHIFEVAKKQALPVDLETLDFISRSGKTLDEAVLKDPKASSIWRNIFSDLTNLDVTLEKLYECGFLVRWFPEMKSMINRVQHDGFHFYTTGIHSIHAVKELVKLRNKKYRRAFPAISESYDLVSRPHVLILATFFHDVGKGRGGDHALAGSLIAADITRRLGFSKLDAQDVLFLVRSHLLMTHLAFRRDIEDDHLIERFAQSIKSPEMLAMLYLLTFADLRSIGPGVWSDWKASLLAALYNKTKIQLGFGGKTKEMRERRVSQVLASVSRALPKDISDREILDFFATLPEKYIFSTNPKTIAAHIVMIKELGTRPVATVYDILRTHSLTEFSVVTMDTPGLFARIAGVLTANGANIVNAELYTSTKGIAIDIFWMTDASLKPFDDPVKWENIRSEMISVIIGNEDIDKIVGGRFRERLQLKSTKHNQPQIVIDNDVSALETVIEILADDRRGLLYTIASVFLKLGCTIDWARITTHVDRVTDVFYIRERDGGKITSMENLNLIQKELFDALDRV